MRQRRRLIRWVLPLASGACAAAALLLLGSILLVLAVSGAGNVDWSFLTTRTRAGGTEGGIFHQIVGTLVLVATASVVVVPPALALAIVREAHLRARPGWRRVIDGGLQLLNGVPSIVFGILGLLFFGKVLGWGKSWLAGGIVLGIMILPTVSIALASSLAAVPKSQIESAAGLGLRRDQIILSILLPQSWAGLLSGLFLGLARAAGETAPILFVAAVFSGAGFPGGVTNAPVLALPYHIFTLAQDTFGEAARANLWGSAFVLVALVGLFSLAALPLRGRVCDASKM